MSVYKPVIKEAEGAVAAAVALLAGDEVPANATINNEVADIPYVQAEIQPIYIDSVHIPVDDGFVDAAEICEGLEDECAAAGITVG